ncbi:MAG: hypothetical protein HY699_15220 [Deltaproteobacteria bacterium]|nr:hypothetical protein [Deltaproteobacteria bacterium]
MLRSYGRRDGAANVQGVGSLPTVRLERRLGQLPRQALMDIKRALVFALALEVAPSSR